MKTIYVFLAEGFEEVEALTPVDVLRRAGLPVKTVSVTGVLTVNGAHGVPVVADMVFEEVKEGDAEMIVLPGGLPGATNLDAESVLWTVYSRKPLEIFLSINQGLYCNASTTL